MVNTLINDFAKLDANERLSKKLFALQFPTKNEDTNWTKKSWKEGKKIMILKHFNYSFWFFV